MEPGGTNGGGIPVVQELNKGTEQQAAPPSGPNEAIETELAEDMEEDGGEEEEEEEEEDTEDDNDDIVDRIIEESPNKRFQKRNRRFPRTPPGVDEAFLALEPETGKEYIWNEIYITREEAETESKLLSIVRRLKKNYHPFLIRFYEIWISSTKKEHNNVTGKTVEQAPPPGQGPVPGNPAAVQETGQSSAITAVASGTTGGPSVPTSTSGGAAMPAGGTTTSVSASPGPGAGTGTEKQPSAPGPALISTNNAVSLNPAVSTPSPLKQKSQNSHSQPRKIVFITERLVEGTLKQYISNSVKTNRAWKRYVGQILSVLRFLTNHGLIHGHLANDNVFLQSSGALKVGTFALDAFLSRKGASEVRQSRGTTRYLAPEYCQQAAVKRALSHEADVYALGVLALEIASWDPTWEALFVQDSKKVASPDLVATSGNSDLPCDGGAERAAEPRQQPAGVCGSSSGGICDRDKLLSLLNQVTNDRQKDFIECCLRLDPAERPSLRNLINHPAMIEVPSLRLLAAKVIVRTIRVHLHLPTREDKRKIDRDSNQKMTEILAGLVDELTGHLESDTVIVEIQFRRGNTVRQRTWKDYNFVDSTKKFLDDVRNGFYLLFGCKPPYHQGEQVDIESDNVFHTGIAVSQGIATTRASLSLVVNTQKSLPTESSGCTQDVSSRRNSFDQDTLTGFKSVHAELAAQVQEAIGGLGTAAPAADSQTRENLEGVIADGPQLAVNSSSSTTDVKQICSKASTGHASSKAQLQRIPTEEGQVLSNTTSQRKSQLRQWTSGQSTMRLSLSDFEGAHSGRDILTPSFMDDLRMTFHTFPIHPAIMQRQFSEPRPVVPARCASIPPYTLKGHLTEADHHSRYFVNPSHEICYPGGMMCGPLGTRTAYQPQQQDMSLYGPTAGQQVGFSPHGMVMKQPSSTEYTGGTVAHLRHTSFPGLEMCLTSSSNSTPIHVNVNPNTANPLSHTSHKERHEQRDVVDEFHSQLVESHEVAANPADASKDEHAPATSHLINTPEANSLHEPYVDTEEEGGEEGTSATPKHPFAQRTDMERPRTVEISTRAGEEKLVDYRHCVVEGCEFCYVGCGRWQLSLYFYLLNEKMTEQIKRTVHAQYLADEWHQADVIVKNLLASNIIRKEQAPVFLYHIHLAAHNKPTKDFQLQEGRIGNEHKGQVDPNDLKKRLQVLSNMLVARNSAADMEQDPEFATRNCFTQPPRSLDAVCELSDRLIEENSKVNSNPQAGRNEAYGLVSPPSSPPVVYAPVRTQLSPPNMMEQGLSPLPLQPYFPLPSPGGFWSPYGYPATSPLEPHAALSPLSIPYILSPTGPMPAFYPQYAVGPVEANTPLMYYQPQFYDTNPTNMPPFHVMSTASRPLTGSGVNPEVTTNVTTSAAVQESYTSTASANSATPSSEAVPQMPPPNQSTNTTQPVPTDVSKTQRNSNAKGNANNNVNNTGQPAPLMTPTNMEVQSSHPQTLLTVDEMMQQLLNNARHMPLSHLGYLATRNPQCAVCDEHSYLHRTDVAIYLASPCYHCREYFAKKAGLTPLAFMNLHYEYKIPWPAFLMVRCGVPTTKYTVRQLIDYDCNIRHRESCVCFPGQELPPCTEFSWSYHRPRHDTVAHKEDTSVPTQLPSEDLPGATTRRVEEVSKKAEQTPEGKVLKQEKRVAVSSGEEENPISIRAGKGGEAGTEVNDSSVPFLSPAQGNHSRPANASTTVVPRKGECSDWNVSYLSQLRVCQERHPPGGQTLCSEGILVPPPETRGETMDVTKTENPVKTTPGVSGPVVAVESDAVVCSNSSLEKSVKIKRLRKVSNHQNEAPLS